MPPRVGPGSAAKQRCSGFSPLNEMKTPKQFQCGLSLPSAYKIFISSFLNHIYSFRLTSRGWEEDDLMERQVLVHRGGEDIFKEMRHIRALVEVQVLCCTCTSTLAVMHSITQGKACLETRSCSKRGAYG